MKKILLVDDEPDLIEVTKSRLEARRYAVVTARDGLDALEKVEAEYPDLILLDLMMPRMNGIQFVERLRQADAPAGLIPIVVVSARTDMRDAFGEGQISGFLFKPYEFHELMKKVKEAFSRPV